MSIECYLRHDPEGVAFETEREIINPDERSNFFPDDSTGNLVFVGVTNELDDEGVEQGYVDGYAAEGVLDPSSPAQFLPAELPDPITRYHMEERQEDHIIELSMDGIACQLVARYLIDVSTNDPELRAMIPASLFHRN